MGRLRTRSSFTIRARLSLLYGVVFLISGAVLLSLGYVFVRSNLLRRVDLQRELGLSLHRHHPGTGVFQRVVYNALRTQWIHQTLQHLLLVYVLALTALTVLSVVAGWLLAGRALAPLRAITATARRVSGENLGERIALTGPQDEIKELADTIDRMLSRLDGAFASQRHFVANASHELRTPLAIMRTEIDVALADPDATAEELREMGEALRESIDRSEGLIAALLALARSEAVAGSEQRVELDVLAGDCVTDLSRRAAAAGVTIDSSGLEPAVVHGDPALLERLLANLIDNGIRHNREGGRLTLTTLTVADRVRLVVANTGALIEPAQVATLTEPFRRLSRQTAGYGLGLSIVASVVAAHGGTLAFRAPDEGGLEVTVELAAEPSGRNARVRPVSVRG
ncbi:HAMP domain-containing sensor histidine kinase [Conexibacter sp. DBS9H8]|uniref:sensor histidine kinase n=1 Tax=Conexibacter sp. DBS9H8 TaxID=2937801 RepID=UPI00200F44E8|nr:HAMP domain-containing sensor histidine kinase [Conexibacter sp. DBS9H8]